MRLDDELIRQAKTWARDHDVSLSELVSGYFHSLTQPTTDQSVPQWLLPLVGVARRNGESPPSDDAIRDLIVKHLEQKHR